jgi:hypothetical protein
MIHTASLTLHLKITPPPHRLLSFIFQSYAMEINRETRSSGESGVLWVITTYTHLSEQHVSSCCKPSKDSLVLYELLLQTHKQFLSQFSLPIHFLPTSLTLTKYKEAYEIALLSVYPPEFFCFLCGACCIKGKHVISSSQNFFLLLVYFITFY